MEYIKIIYKYIYIYVYINIYKIYSRPPESLTRERRRVPEGQCFSETRFLLLLHVFLSVQILLFGTGGEREVSLARAPCLNSMCMKHTMSSCHLLATAGE